MADGSPGLNKSPGVNRVSGRPEIERPLPYNLEAERAIFGAILLANTVTKNIEEAFACLEPASFFLPEHRIIFSRMKCMHEQGKPANDLVVLCESLIEANELEAAGEVGYISSIADRLLPRVTNLAQYVQIVKTKARLRELAYIAETILEKILSANGNATEVLREVFILSALLGDEVGQKRILYFKSGREFGASTDDQIKWIVPGYVAKGAITELGARVKVGKTTLILNAVRAAADGHIFLGNPTLKTATVYLTEQPSASFRQAMERAGLLDRDDFHILLHNETQMAPWPEIVSAAVAECKRVGASLLVVDTLPQFARLIGDSENNSGDALAAMLPLQLAAAEGLAVVIVRHERKSGGDVGDSGRGSSAFAGAVDIVISLRKKEGNSKKTIRLLQAVSRFPETPAQQVIELRGSTYVSLGEPHETAMTEAKTSIISAAPKSESAAVRVESFMETCELPRVTAQRAIDELRNEGMLARVGEGKKGNPYRYFTPEIPFCPTPNIYGQEEKQTGSAGHQEGTPSKD